MRVRYNFSSRKTGHIENIRKQREKFPSMVRNMIRICDIILEVLDARFIDKTQNKVLESLILRNNKKLFYVINKLDLVDKAIKKKEISEKNLYPYIFISCKNRVGIAELRNKIKIAAKRVKTEKKVIHIGIIGYPNTGKSSLINLLTGKSSAKTASEPGFTKRLKKIKLTEGIVLFDTPGVIPDSEYSMTSSEKMAHHAMVNARDYNKVKNPDFIINTVMQEYPGKIEEFYNIDAKGNAEELIDKLGKKKNFLLKGGVIDVDRTSRFILKEWQEGKIKF